MERFKRIAGQNHPTREAQRAGFELAAELLNAHSEAIEALAERIDISANIGRDREERAGEWREAQDKRLLALDEAVAYGQGFATGLESRVEALAKDVARLTPIWEQRRKPAVVLGDFHRGGLIPTILTHDKAVDIILAEQDKVLAELGDENIRVWIRGVVALLTRALRDHGREDR